MTYIECGCCDHYHRESYSGDCRQDSERFTYDEIPMGAYVLEMEEQMRATETHRDPEPYLK